MFLRPTVRDFSGCPLNSLVLSTMAVCRCDGVVGRRLEIAPVQHGVNTHPEESDLACRGVGAVDRVKGAHRFQVEWGVVWGGVGEACRGYCFAVIERTMVSAKFGWLLTE